MIGKIPFPFYLGCICVQQQHMCTCSTRYCSKGLVSLLTPDPLSSHKIQPKESRTTSLSTTKCRRSRIRIWETSGGHAKNDDHNCFNFRRTILSHFLRVFNTPQLPSYKQMPHLFQKTKKHCKNISTNKVQTVPPSPQHMYVLLIAFFSVVLLKDRFDFFWVCLCFFFLFCRAICWPPHLYYF